MYKIDNKNLRAKIKNLEQRLDFQRYNIKEKQKEKGRKKKKELLTNKQTKKTPTTIQRVYMVFALKKKIVIIGYRNKNQRRNRRLNNLKKVRKKEKRKKNKKQKNKTKNKE